MPLPEDTHRDASEAARSHTLPCLFALASIALLFFLHWAGHPEGRFLYINSLPIPDSFLTFFSFFGSFWGSMAIIYPLHLVGESLFFSVLSSSLMANLLTYFLKHAFGHPRPLLVFSQLDQAIRIVGTPILGHTSTPSGHTTTAFAIASALYCSLPPRQRSKAPFVIAFCTGLSRICVGAHWVEDVLMGAFVGLISGAFTCFICNSANRICQKNAFLEGIARQYCCVRTRACHTWALLPWMALGLWLLFLLSTGGLDIGGPSNPLQALCAVVVAWALLHQTRALYRWKTTSRTDFSP